MSVKVTMISVRQMPHLATPDLLARLRGFCRYDEGGRSSLWLVPGGVVLLPELEEVARAVFPDVPFKMWSVLLQGYRDGTAATPCHADLGYGVSFILSLGAARTLRLHRVPEGATGCGDYDLDVTSVECVNGTAVITDRDFHRTHHHQVVPDEGAGERLSLVFRTGEK